MKAMIAFSFMLLIFLSQAQVHSLAKQWDQRYGGTNGDGLTIFQQTSDGGYILGGYSQSGISGNKTQPNWDTTEATDDYWIVKIDSLGAKQWDKRFGGAGDEVLYGLQQCKDNGYVIGGPSISGISGDKTQPCWGADDYWIVKTDSLGNKRWDKRFGGTNEDFMGCVIQTSDGGYIFGGFSFSDISGDRTQASRGLDDYWVVKIDSSGDKQWDKRFGTPTKDVLTSLTQTSDGGYMLGGSTYGDSIDDKTQHNWDTTLGSYDYWIVKVDSASTKQWDKRYGGNHDDEFAMLQQTFDGGYILAGTSGSDSGGDKTTSKYGYWIVKIDSLGNKQWDNAYTGGDYLYSVVQTNDRGYLLAGPSSQMLAAGDKTQNNLGATQTWIVKTDSFGNKEWDKTAFTYASEGGLAIQTSDGCYAIANTTSANIGGDKSQLSWANTPDYWIIKFCDTLISGIDDLSERPQINIYPNPFTTDLAINVQQANLKQATFSIYNMLGQQIYYRQEDALSPSYTKMLDLRYLPNGIYVVEVEVDGACVSREVVKQ